MKQNIKIRKKKKKSKTGFEIASNPDLIKPVPINPSCSIANIKSQSIKPVPTFGKKRKKKDQYE